jgi:hypothetical protein
MYLMGISWYRRIAGIVQAVMQVLRGLQVASALLRTDRTARAGRFPTVHKPQARSPSWERRFSSPTKILGRGRRREAFGQSIGDACFMPTKFGDLLAPFTVSILMSIAALPECDRSSRAVDAAHHFG